MKIINKRIYRIHIENTGVSDFVYRTVFYKLENTTLWTLDLFLFSGEKETTALLDPLEGANLNHWTTYVSITTGI
jgi:hypothetical protein